MWCNYNGWRSQLERPNRVRLADGSTRTAEEITDEQLAADGWFWEVPAVIQNAPEDPTTATNIIVE